LCYAHRAGYIILNGSQGGRSVCAVHARIPPFSGGLWLPSGDILIWHSSPNAHKWLVSRKPPSEAACKVSFNLYSWVILPTKVSPAGRFSCEKLHCQRHWRTSSHACRDMRRNTLPASVAAALGSEVSPTWLPRGPSGNLRALNKLHPSLLPLTGCASS